MDVINMVHIILDYQCALKTVSRNSTCQRSCRGTHLNELLVSILLELPVLCSSCRLLLIFTLALPTHHIIPPDVHLQTPKGGRNLSSEAGICNLSAQGSMSHSSFTVTRQSASLLASEVLPWAMADALFLQPCDMLHVHAHASRCCRRHQCTTQAAAAHLCETVEALGDKVLHV